MIKRVKLIINKKTLVLGIHEILEYKKQKVNLFVLLMQMICGKK